MYRTFRVLVAAALVATAALIAFAGTAAAKGKPPVVTLTCAATAPEVDATVQFTSGLNGPNIGDPVNVSCLNGTTDSQKVNKLPELPTALHYTIGRLPGTNCPEYQGDAERPLTHAFSCSASDPTIATLTVS